MSTLIKWNLPRNGTNASLFDALFSDPFFGAVPRQGAEAVPVAYSPAAELEETENALRLSVDLPGHDPKAIQISAEGDTLTVRSERKPQNLGDKGGAVRSERSYGLFARSFVLPSEFDAAKAEAKYENGVLTLVLPKREEAKPRTITVKVQS